METCFLPVIRVVAVALVLSLLPVADSEAKKRAFRSVPDSFSSLSEKASPTVVNISTVKIIKGGGRVFRHFFTDARGPQGDRDPMREFFDRFFGDEGRQDFKQRSLGSGFIIDKDGYIVTNNHVIEDADQIKVILSDEEEYDAEIIGRDPNTDIALIKIQSGQDLPIATLGDSGTLKVGEWVVAIGNPFGLDHTVTAGIVSAKGRAIGAGHYDDFIQTDASINPGNSGGPLLDMDGKVVGINTMIQAGGQGIGFAIPIDLAKNVIDQLKEKGEVTRGWLGVTIQDLTEELADYYGMKNRKGVLVTDVISGDPAEQAGIEPKDIIVKIDGRSVEDMRELLSIVAETGVGETVDVKVFRNGGFKTFQVNIGRRDEDKLASRAPSDRHQDGLGLQLSEITPDMARRFNVDETDGAIVIGVKPGSKGDDAGIQVGDVIKEVNRQPVGSPRDYYSIIRKAKTGETILIYMRRLNQRHMIVKIEK